MTLWQRLVDDFLAPLRAADDEQHAYLASAEGTRFDKRTVGTLLTVAIMLTTQEYFVHSSYAAPAARAVGIMLPPEMGHSLADWTTDASTARLAGLTYWAVGQVVTYLVIPALVVRFVFQDRLTDYGLKLRGVCRHAWLYAAMYLFMAGPVILAGATPAFLHTYPFYRVEPGAPFWPRIISWELLYAMQFVALEFFFRGFLLHGCRRRFGPYAIFVMVVPYCMIHFQKPMLETLGAVVAGIVLGYMSLRTRSIWLGAALHIAVAWTMDAAAIWQSP